MPTSDFRSDVPAVLARHVDLRLLGTKFGNKGDMEALAKAMADSETLQDTLWQQVLALNDNDTANPVARGLFIEAINEFIDIQTKRITVALKRLPSIIVVSIGFTLVLTMSVLGYRGGLSDLRSVFVVSALALSLSFVCILILPLERPGTSLFSAGQQAMLSLKTAISRLR